MSVGYIKDGKYIPVAGNGGGGTGIYVQEEIPSEIEISEHWFKVVATLNPSDYDYILPNEPVVNIYRITYVLDGGTNGSNPSTIKETDTVTLKDATKDGFKFIGWYSDSGFTTKIETLSNITSNITLYAKFEEIEEENTVETTYLYNYGDECVSVTGGWNQATDSTGYDSDVVTMSKNTDHLYIYAKVSGNPSFMFNTTNVIDTTQYDRIGIKYKFNGDDLSAYLGTVYLANWTSMMSSNIRLQENSTETTTLSNLDYKYTDMHVAVRVQEAGGEYVEAFIYQIWLEKDVTEETEPIIANYIYDDNDEEVCTDCHSGEEKVYIDE